MRSKMVWVRWLWNVFRFGKGYCSQSEKILDGTSDHWQCIGDQPPVRVKVYWIRTPVRYFFVCDLHIKPYEFFFFFLSHGNLQS